MSKQTKIMLLLAGLFGFLLLCCCITSGTIIAIVSFTNDNEEQTASENTNEQEEENDTSEDTEDDNQEDNENNNAKKIPSSVSMVFEDTSDVRELPYSEKKLQVKFVSQEELAQKMKEITDEERDKETEEKEEIFWKALGVIPADMDLYKTLEEYYSEDTLGFYHPEEKIFYISVDDDEYDLKNLGPMLKFTISHEFTHYLQDYNFDLVKLDEKYDPDTEGNEDIYQAYSALVEGDATLTSMLYVVRNYDDEEYNEFWDEIDNTEESDVEIPDIIDKSISFIYFDGMDFVSYGIGDEYDYSRIDKAFHNMPQSTEQILHPEKYFTNNPDVPSEVTHHDKKLQEVESEIDFSQSWERYYSHYAIGELDTKLIFEDFLSEETAAKAAEGWDGNKTAFYYNKDTKEFIIVMSYVWDSDQDAQEYVDAANKYCKAAGFSSCQINAHNNTTSAVLKGKLEGVK